MVDKTQRLKRENSGPKNSALVDRLRVLIPLGPLTLHRYPLYPPRPSSRDRARIVFRLPITCEPPAFHRPFLHPSMNSTPSKVFLVTVMDCENRSHARKIAGLLRAFPYREYGTADEPSVSLSMMVKSDSLDSVRTAITPALGKAKAAIGEMSFVSDNKMSSEPFDFMRFKAATRLGSTPAQK